RCPDKATKCPGKDRDDEYEPSQRARALLFSAILRSAARSFAAGGTRGHHLLVSGADGQVKPGWQMLGRVLCAAAMQKPPIKRLEELFAAEPDRLARLSFEAVGIYFDWSKTHLDQSLVSEFLARAE